MLEKINLFYQYNQVKSFYGGLNMENDTNNMSSMNRRKFLKTLAIAGAAFTLKIKDGMDVFAQTVGAKTGKPVDLVAVIGGEPAGGC